MKDSMASKKWVTHAATAVLLCSILGCSGDAKDAAEDHLTSETQKNYPDSIVYLSSEDGVFTTATFAPDRVHENLTLLATCFADDRGDMAEIRMMQGSEVLTTFETGCSLDQGYSGFMPTMFDTDGEDITIEMTEEDAKDLLFRVVGHND